MGYNLISNPPAITFIYMVQPMQKWFDLKKKPILTKSLILGSWHTVGFPPIPKCAKVTKPPKATLLYCSQDFSTALRGPPPPLKWVKLFTLLYTILFELIPSQGGCCPEYWKEWWFRTARCCWHRTLPPVCGRHPI